MQVKVTGRHMNPTESTRAYAEEKFGRIAKIHDAEALIAEVVLEAQKNRSNPDRFVAEVTVRLKGHVVRAEEAANDMHAAIDLAAAKAETQMRKYKSRVVDRRSGKRAPTVVKTAPGDDQMPVPEESQPVVTRTKIVECTADDRGRSDSAARASRTRLLRLSLARTRARSTCCIGGLAATSA